MLCIPFAMTSQSQSKWNPANKLNQFQRIAQERFANVVEIYYENHVHKKFLADMYAVIPKGKNAHCGLPTVSAGCFKSRSVLIIRNKCNNHNKCNHKCNHKPNNCNHKPNNCKQSHLMKCACCPCRAWTTRGIMATAQYCTERAWLTRTGSALRTCTVFAG